MSDPIGRIIICQPPASCTCPAVAWRCRGDCKGAVAARAAAERDRTEDEENAR